MDVSNNNNNLHMQTQHHGDSSSSMPLLKWMEHESSKAAARARQNNSNGNGTSTERRKKEMLLRKTTVAYGIAELLRHHNVVIRRSKNEDHHNKVNQNEAGNTATGEISELASLLHSQEKKKKSSQEYCNINNFNVRLAPPEEESGTSMSLLFSPTSQATSTMASWNNIQGVDMILASSPQANSTTSVSVNIIEPSFLFGNFNDDAASIGSSYSRESENNKVIEEYCGMGKYFEVEFPSDGSSRTLSSSAEAEDEGKSSEEDASNQSEEEHGLCRSLGALLYESYSQLSPLPAGAGSNNIGGNGDAKGTTSKEPPSKRTKLIITEDDDGDLEEDFTITSEKQSAILSNPAHVPLAELGIPSSLCMLVQNLLESGCVMGEYDNSQPQEAYTSLNEVVKDLHILLLDPSRFLFDHNKNCAEESGGGNSKMQLSFRKNKLYGREKEVSLITDAFCRVSGGNSEAVFIGGFSGSGKSILVNSLTARVDVAEGYVLTHKFDQMSKERPLLEVISVFNDLCLLILKKRTQHELLTITNQLMGVFGTDFSMLVRLLPNVTSLYPQLKDDSSMDKGGGGHDQINLRSACFILQRFMRVVSSKSHPVMLFLDDLQWCDNSAMSLVEGLLTDLSGSSCLLFVGSYRNNEVKNDHSIFSLMDSLRTSGVPVTKLGLDGLGQEDLNTLISDAMCMFPRLCMPLSDIIFQKTKGNPFFVLEFLRSLVDGGLLQYSTEKHRWIWDEDRINSMDIAGNVLYLLSSKMSRMSKNVQSALKVAACFGIKMKQSVVGILSDSSEYSDICDGLDQAVKEGFMDKLGVSDFKFVHDKVQEAAYRLLPDDEKKQYHYELGMTLHSLTEGSDVDDIIFSIADQINHGIDNVPAHKSNVRIALAKVNKLAGAKAVELSDFATARSYLNVALSLLPSGHWQSHYDMSLQLSTLLAKSCYSCGDANKARCILQEILEESSCIEDKLPAYFLLVTVLNSCGKGMDAYTTCHEILCQLGEKIPQSMGGKETNELVESTSKMAEIITDNTLIEMEEMDDKTSIVLKFYTLMSTVAFFARPDMLPYLSCKTVDLTLKHGMCKYSLMGLIQFALVLCRNKLAMDIPGSSRIGNAVVSCLKNRYPSAVDQLPRVYFSYYGLVAFHTETLQSCTDMIRQGFDVGMSIGDSDTAFFCAIHHIKMSLFGGEQLFTLLERVDYYLELADQYKNELAKSYLSIYRDTISTLIDKGEVTGSKKHAPTEAMSNPSKSLSATIYFHRAIQAYWLGHSERCHHYIGKFLQISTLTRLNTVVVTFIHGLNSFQVLKRQNTAKLRAIPKNAIVSLKTATSHSRWNFRNKVHLLEAENFSCRSNHEEAKASYAAAITSARCSRFLHEQGLACELAGIHYQKIGDHRSAWSFFNQAKQCYAEWGSQLKVDAINRQLGSIQVPLSNGNL